MAFGSKEERRAAFAKMKGHKITELKTKSSHYIKDERMAVGEYNEFKKDIDNAGLPKRLVDKVGAAAKDEHRHMNDMIEVKEALNEFKKVKQKPVKKVGTTAASLPPEMRGLWKHQYKPRHDILMANTEGDALRKYKESDIYRKIKAIDNLQAKGVFD